MSNWVTVLTVSYPQQLWIIRTKLESEGIECFIKDELTVQSYSLYSNAIGGVKLQVLEEDVEGARGILMESGYLQEAPVQIDLLTKADGKTSSIPFLKNLSITHRIIIITLIFVTLLTTLIYFIVRPSLSDQLTQKSWCVDRIDYNNKTIGPKTTGFIVTMTLTNRNGESECSERMTFLEMNNNLTLPGVNTSSASGRWEINNDGNIEISTGSLKNIYDGTYKVDLSKDILILKSKTTVIYAHMNNFNISLPF